MKLNLVNRWLRGLAKFEEIGVLSEGLIGRLSSGVIVWGRWGSFLKRIVDGLNWHAEFIKACALNVGVWDQTRVESV